MDESKEQPLTEEQAMAIAELTRAKANSIHRAYQTHTRGLFGLWLLLIVGISWVSLGLFSDSKESASSFAVLVITFWLILFTGGYVFQEVRTLHRRIDGLLTLIDKK